MLRKRHVHNNRGILREMYTNEQDFHTSADNKDGRHYQTLKYNSKAFMFMYNVYLVVPHSPEVVFTIFAETGSATCLLGSVHIERGTLRLRLRLRVTLITLSK